MENIFVISDEHVNEWIAKQRKYERRLNKLIVPLKKPESFTKFCERKEREWRKKVD